MALTGSLQLSLSLGFCRNHERSKKFKYVTGRETRQLMANELSSCASRQDSWSGRLSSSTNRTLYTLPYKCSPLRCHSFLVFGQNISVPTMKSASVALTRSCNSLQANPLVMKLVPAAAIIVFTLWGLQPLMQFSRRIFLHKSDNSWKKSTANYVMSSYLQPILLWTAAILICRNLEPIAMPTEASEVVKQRLLNFVKSLSSVLAFAYCFSSVIQQAQKYFLETSDPSETRNMSFQFAGKAVYTAVWVAAVSLFMELLGFSTQKWLTAGGLGTVLLTLAGREIFTNFLSSAMIHATRPFVANEWIQTKIEGYEVSGTVEHVGWWSPTVIRGEDREAVHIPNHKFTVNVVRNLSQKTHWRIKTHLAISHLDASKINSIVADMRKVLAKNPQVEQQKLHRRVFLENVNPENQAMMILISCFVKTSHHEEYLCVKEAILLDLLRVIKHHRARLATPIRTIQKYYNEPDLDSMSFSDSIFTRAGPMSKRPVLLIEPPYKINGEDKSKSQARAARTSEIQDINGSEQSTVELNVDAKVKGLSTPELNAKEMPKSGNKTDGVAPDSSNVDPSVEGKASVASKAEPKSDSKASVASKAEPKADGKASAVSKGSSNPELKNKDMPQPGNKADGKEAGSSNVGPNIENRASVTSKSDPKSDAKATVKTTPRPKSGSEKSSAPNGNALKNIENGQPKGNTETQGNDDKTSNPTLSTQAKHGDKSTASEPSKSTAPALEENIVLEVALEGSKRTLPIEEDDTSKTSAEVKELATRSNETGTPSGNKDEKNT